MEYLLYHMLPTVNKIWEDKDQQNTGKFGYNTSFLCKNRTTTYLSPTPSKLFYFTFVDVFYVNH